MRKQVAAWDSSAAEATFLRHFGRCRIAHSYFYDGDFRSAAKANVAEEAADPWIHIERPARRLIQAHIEVSNSKRREHGTEEWEPHLAAVRMPGQHQLELAGAGD